MTYHTASEHSSDINKKLRRLRLLIRRGMFSELPENSLCKRATTVDELREAYQLVYNVYVAQNYIPPNDAQMRIRAFEALPDTATFISQSNNTTVGVFSAVMDSDELKLPSDKVFSAELASLRDSDALLCEFSNQAILPDYRSTPVVTELMKTMFAHIWFHNVTDAVCAISPGQVEFFRLLGFVQRSEVKNYSDIVYDPVILMHLPDVQNIYRKPDIPNQEPETFLHHFFTLTNVYLSVIPFWDAMAKRLFNDSKSMQALFAECIPEFKQLSAMERAVISRHTGLETVALESGEESFSETVF